MPLILGVVAIMIGIWLAVMLIWILIVLVFRALAWILGMAILASGVTFLAGLVIGFIIPIRVTRGIGLGGARIATPEALAAGEVISGAPPGTSRHFGWDPAWPNYVPHQLKFDVRAVWYTSRRAAAKAVRVPFRFVVRGRKLSMPVVCLIWLFVPAVPSLALAGGILLSTFAWWIIVMVFRTLVSLGQSVTTAVMRAREQSFMKKLGAKPSCMHCHQKFDMPSYKCPNAECGRMHRDVSPGPLGIRTRICVCGDHLDLTIPRASTEMDAFCPFCNKALTQGAGTRRVVSVPVFGSVGTGKTQFLSSVLVGLADPSAVHPSPTAVHPLSPAAEGFLDAARLYASTGMPPAKTEYQEQPEGNPYLLSYGEKNVELQLTDAAGESFVESRTSEGLRYFDESNVLVFLVDPLTFPEVQEELRSSSRSSAARVAQGSAENAYGSIVDRLRDAGYDLRDRRLAVVLSKADIIDEVFDADPLPTTSEGIRGWLLNHGGDALVRRAEFDFRELTYFAVTSSHVDITTSSRSPLRVIDWSITTSGGASLGYGTPNPEAFGNQTPEPVH